MHIRRSILGGLVLAVALAPTAGASDGVLEISQTCAAVGCSPGDSAGFPVTTQAGQAYALTSSLTVPDENTTAVSLSDGSSLDLRGFTIQGPTTCSGLPALCTATGSGAGVATGTRSSVRNGAIRGMGAYGVSGGGGLQAVDLLVESNGVDGIRFGAFGAVSGQGMIRNCQVIQNGGIGINFNYGNPQGSLIVDSVVHGNGSDGLRGNGALIHGNRFSSNGGFGISVSSGGEGTGYADNVFLNNNGGNANAQTSGGTQMGTNMCGFDTTCP